EQGLEEPGERRVLVADVRLELVAGPALRGSRCRAGEPVLDPEIGLAGLEVVHEIAQDEHAAGREQIGEAGEGDALPEVGEVMQRVARVDELWRIALVLVREEAGLDPLHGVALPASYLEHGRRRIDTDDAPRLGGGGHGEQAGAAADVDEHRVGPEPVAEQSERGFEIELCLSVVPRDVTGLEMLRSCVRALVEAPAAHAVRTARPSTMPRRMDVSASISARRSRARSAAASAYRRAPSAPCSRT